MTGQIDPRARWETLWRRLWAFSARLDVTAGLLAVLVLLSIIGSTIPQRGLDVAADPQRAAAWETALRAKHGAWGDFLITSGAVQFFQTGLFLLPWGVLILFTLLCALHRWPTIWYSLHRDTVRCTPVQLHEAPHSASIPDTDRATWEQLREALERDGYHVHIEMDVAGWFLRAERHRWARSATLVTHLAVILMGVGVLLNLQLGWREELAIPVGGSALVRHADLPVHNTAFEVIRYPDGNVAAYEAHIRVQETLARIRVNEPLVYQGIGFHLSGYMQIQDRTVVVLQVTYAPGYVPLIVAGFLMLVGMAVTFNMPFRRIQACRTADGVLQLGGWADRRAYGFARAFETLVQELRAGKGTQLT
ncbi:MAG: cytochrome c biogenesis protein ResB [Anaerolineae bacterium]|nr:cytochrome c biogenesis protein ResB [Anaerolineae bacterium]MDW8070577.1 cytochrome c biogenesis protein ResB [Anaerolineae bacterium]